MGTWGFGQWHFVSDALSGGHGLDVGVVCKIYYMEGATLRIAVCLTANALTFAFTFAVLLSFWLSGGEQDPVGER